MTDSSESANANANASGVALLQKKSAPSSSRRTLAKSEARPSPSAPHLARARALLITEIEGVESLSRGMKRDDPSLPIVLRRVAADYAELEKGARADGASRIEANAREHAIQYYLRTLDARSAATRVDEVNYLLAREYERAGDYVRARRSYLDVMAVPNSRYAPHAMIAFGDMLFDEATSDDSKWNLAEAAYLKVLDYGPEQNRVYGYALYKLGWTLEHQGDHAKALRFFNQAIDFANVNSRDAELARIGDIARADLAALTRESSLALTPSEANLRAP